MILSPLLYAVYIYDLVHGLNAKGRLDIGMKKVILFGIKHNDIGMRSTVAFFYAKDNAPMTHD